MLSSIEANEITENDYDEANIIMTKVKCYNCGELGHFSRNCKKPRKFRKVDRVQLVECPDDYELAFESSPKTSDEVNFITDMDLQFVLDSGATTHVVNDQSLLTNTTKRNILIKGINGDEMCCLEGMVQIGLLKLLNVKYMPNAPTNIISIPNYLEMAIKY